MNPIQTLENSYQIFEGFWKVRIRPNSSAIGQKLQDLHLDSEMGISVVKIIPFEIGAIDILKKVGLSAQESDKILEENIELKMNDELILNCSENRVQRFIDKYNVAAQKIEGDSDFVKENILSDEIGLSELIVAPRSSYRGKKINVGPVCIKIQRSSHCPEPLQQKNQRTRICFTGGRHHTGKS